MNMHKLIPLRWERSTTHPEGAWYGYAANGGHHVCFIYQPSQRRGQGWSRQFGVFAYIGEKEKPLRTPTDKERLFTTPKQAKCAAQAWWRREICKLFRA